MFNIPGLRDALWAIEFFGLCGGLYFCVAALNILVRWFKEIK